MFTNFYDKFKKNIKENYKSYLFLLLIYIIFMIPVNYYIIIGGGIMEIGNRIEVENAYKSKGSLNLAYVKEIKGTIATYLLSYVIPEWSRQKVNDYTYNDDEDLQDIMFRGTVDLLSANSNAIKNAYNEANKDFNVTEKKLYVYYIDDKSKNELKVGDQILKVNDNKLVSFDILKNEISSKNVNDSINIQVKRNNKIKNVKATIYENKDKKVLGILAREVYEYKTNPKIKIKFKKGESGPSGGVIETLDIYNKITKKDITNGMKIAGTGEIDIDGNITSIGGVKYKLLGAEKKNADIFIVPNGENYKECIKLKKEKKLKVKIIGVSSFKETINKLKKIK